MPKKRPLCPVCNNQMSRTIVGMPSDPLPECYISIGCIAEEENPEWLCAKCTENCAWGIAIDDLRPNP